MSCLVPGRTVTPYIAVLAIDRAGCEVIDRVKGSGCKAFFTGYNTVKDLITHTLLVEGDAKEIIESLRNSGLRVHSAKTGSDKTLVIVSKKPCHLCQIPYHGVNYTVLHHTVDDRGRAVVRIAAARSKTIENLVKMLEKKNYRVLRVNVTRWFRGSL